MPINIFFCSVREDEALLKQLQAHLRPLERAGLIRFWYDRTIRRGGDRWRSQVMRHLTTAQIVLVLVSSDFMDSDYCYDFEMRRALMLGEGRVIPIIVRPVYWRLGPLATLQPLPDEGKPVTGPDWHTIDDAFKNITEGIYKVVKQLKFVPIPVERLSVLRILNHKCLVTDIAISADGHVLVSGSKDGSIKVWKGYAGEPAYPLTSHTGAVRRMAMSPDGQTLVSGSDDCTIRVWNLFRGKQTRLLEGHRGPVECVAMSSDEQTLVSGSADGTIKVWDLSTGEIKCSSDINSGTVYCLAISANGRTMVSGSADGRIRVWDMPEIEEEEGNLEIVKTLKGHTDYVYSIAISADGQTLISGSGDHTGRIWNLSKEHEPVPLIGYEGSVTVVAMSPDEQTFFTGSTDGKIHVWDRSGTVVHTLDHKDAVSAIVISTDGKTFVSADDKGMIKIWGEI